MVITLLLHHKENEDKGEFMDACFEGAICKFALTCQGGHKRVAKNVYSILKLTPKHILGYIYYQCLI